MWGLGLKIILLNDVLSETFIEVKSSSLPSLIVQNYLPTSSPSNSLLFYCILGKVLPASLWFFFPFSPRRTPFSPYLHFYVSNSCSAAGLLCKFFPWMLGGIQALGSPTLERIPKVPQLNWFLLSIPILPLLPPAHQIYNSQLESEFQFS